MRHLQLRRARDRDLLLRAFGGRRDPYAALIDHITEEAAQHLPPLSAAQRAMLRKRTARHLRLRGLIPNTRPVAETAPPAIILQRYELEPIGRTGPPPPNENRPRKGAMGLPKGGCRTSVDIGKARSGRTQPLS